MASNDKQKSYAWKYFELEENESKKVTICQICKAKLAYHGGTSAMINHIKSKHPSTKISEGKPNSQVGELCTEKTMKDSWSKPVISSAKAEEITMKLALMCALDMRPLSIVEGTGFQNFVHALNPAYKIPCRKTISKYLTKIYEDGKNDLTQQLKDNSIALTTDLWTSVSHQGYISLTSHYIDTNWNIQSNSLATKLIEEKHTGKNIAAAITNILDKFSITDPSCVTTDNAANMEVAARELAIGHIGKFIFLFYIYSSKIIKILHLKIYKQLLRLTCTICPL
jgi:hypothetical protein